MAERPAAPVRSGGCTPVVGTARAASRYLQGPISPAVGPQQTDAAPPAVPSTPVRHGPPSRGRCSGCAPARAVCVQQGGPLAPCPSWRRLVAGLPRLRSPKVTSLRAPRSPSSECWEKAASPQSPLTDLSTVATSYSRRMLPHELAGAPFSFTTLMPARLRQNRRRPA